MPIRQPTTAAQKEDWWLDALIYGVQSVPQEPQCGLYLYRHKAGHLFPVKIDILSIVDSAGELVCDEIYTMRLPTVGLIDEQERIHSMWSYLAKNPIDTTEYQRRMREIREAVENDPFGFLANLKREVDLASRPTKAGDQE